MSDVDLEAETWIEWFCCLRGNEFLCEVDQSFVEDNFNLYGLRAVIPHYRDCLELLLDAAAGSDRDDWDGPLFEHARDLFGLIHQRFILTTRGLAMMAQKYEEGDFGTCPRVYCENQRVLPAGLSDELRVQPVVLFCPKCCDTYYPPKDTYRDLDGAYFGRTFAHLLLLSKPALVPEPTTRVYEPRIFGFRVHPTANFPTNRARLEDPRAKAEAARQKKRDAAASARRAAGEGAAGAGGAGTAEDPPTTNDPGVRKSGE
mmetsp:Transcript_10764/g.25680  ORF Transcript_10764/g.25680 Transcript_10764/m.25680 type:complete len:259 (-) Transcript_10764:90-866(-)